LLDFTFLAAFLLVFARVSGFIAVFPLFALTGVPALLRLGLAFILALIVTPVAGKGFAAPAAAGYVFALANEVLFGLATGLTAALVFYALRMAGQLMGIQIGFAVAELLDPAGIQNNVVAEFVFLLGVIFFFSVDGHHAVIAALVRSFEMVPLTTGAVKSSVVPYVARLIGGMFSTALQLAAPVLAVMVVVDLALGLMVRMVPQINVFMLGFPLKVAAGLLILAGLLPVLGVVLRQLFDRMVADILVLVRGLA
jgi:flagellar biosynthetic protein FliR